MEIELITSTPDPEAVIELAARTCYMSQTMMRHGSASSLLPKLLASGHESPFEHASATFMIRGCSRAMTHQLVRHRLLSVSQKSQRYVSEHSFDYVTPPAMQNEHRYEFDRDMATIREMYSKWKRMGVRNEDARFVLPNACSTEIMISGNFREFRHIFRVRCSPHAQWEIHQACRIMLSKLLDIAPSVFQDIAIKQ
jgi:thymidylate synthase (FAD)